MCSRMERARNRKPHQKIAASREGWLAGQVETESEKGIGIYFVYKHDRLAMRTADCSNRTKEKADARQKRT